MRKVLCGWLPLILLGVIAIYASPSEAGPIFVGAAAENIDILINNLGGGVVILNINKIFIGNVFNIIGGIIDPPITTPVYSPFNGPTKTATATYDSTSNQTT